MFFVFFRAIGGVLLCAYSNRFFFFQKKLIQLLHTFNNKAINPYYTSRYPCIVSKRLPAVFPLASFIIRKGSLI
jgi:hypothetical protein